MKTPFIILTAALTSIWFASCSHDVKPAANIENTLKARVAVVTKRDVPRILSVRGTIHADDDAVLSSRAMGPVVRELVRLGDRVRKGDVLLEIDERMNAGMLAQAKGALSQALAAHALAATNFKRFEALFETQACSQLELDMARMQFETAEGAVKQAQGAVDAAAAVADESSIRAPFDGLIVEKFVNVGDLIAPGRPLIRVQTVSGRSLHFSMRAADAAALQVGSELTCKLDDPAQELKAIITEIAPAADPITHTVAVRAQFNNDIVLAAGHSAIAEIPGELIEVLLAPQSAIYSTGGLQLATIVDADGVAKTRTVTVGRTRGADIEILSGLTAGDSVVLDRTDLIAEGTRIARING